VKFVDHALAWVRVSRLNSGSRMDTDISSPISTSERHCPNGSEVDRDRYGVERDDEQDVEACEARRDHPA
jgi:hypothetical protein